MLQRQNSVKILMKRAPNVERSHQAICRRSTEQGLGRSLTPVGAFDVFVYICHLPSK